MEISVVFCFTFITSMCVSAWSGSVVCQEAVKCHLNGGQGQSSICSNPSSCHCLLLDCSLLMAAMCHRFGWVLSEWESQSRGNRSQRDCRMTSSESLFPDRRPLRNNLTCPVWDSVRSSRSWLQVKLFPCYSKLIHWDPATEWTNLMFNIKGDNGAVT